MLLLLTASTAVFLPLCVVFSTPIEVTLLATLSLLITATSAHRVNIDNYAQFDRFAAILCLCIVGAICNIEPHLATTVLYAPIGFYIVSAERSRRWRRGLLAATGCGFLMALALATDDRVAPVLPDRLWTISVEVHCIVCGGVIAMITLMNRTLNARTHRAAVEQNARTAAHNAALAVANDALAARRERLRVVEADIQAAIREEAVAQRRLEAAYEPLRQFALAASHDLKEPVRTIRAFMARVRRDLPADLRDDVGAAEDFGFVETGCVHMQQLLERLLAYHRTGQASGDPERLCLRALWRKSFRVALAERTAARRALPSGPGPSIAQLEHLRTADPDEFFHAEGFLEADGSLREGGEPTVAMVREHAERLFGELLRNALTFHDGSRDIAVGLRVRRLPDGTLECLLVDNGLGVEEAFRESVFGMFKRLHPRERYPGSGLGLSLARRVCQAVGAEIAFADAGQVGARVRVTFPASVTGAA